MARQVATAAINTLRDSHYVLNSVSALYERSVLLEGASTNLVLQSENFGTTWTAIGTPTRTAAAVPASVMGVALDLIGDDDATALEGYFQPVTFTADGVKALSLCVKQGTSTSSLVQLYDNTAATSRMSAVLTWSSGVPSLAMTGGTYYGAESLANGVYRLWFATAAVTAANVNRVYVYPATTLAGAVANTGDIYAGGVQAENSTFPTSYIPTTTGTVTRGADSYSVPFTTPPQAMTLYTKFVERGTATAAGNRRILQVGTITGSASDRDLQLRAVTGNVYQFIHENSDGSSPVSASAVALPAFGDTVELRAILNADGSVQLGQSINGAAEVTTTTSAAKALPATWSAQTLFLACSSAAGANAGFAAFLVPYKVALGVQTMDQMRALRAN